MGKPRNDQSCLGKAIMRCSTKFAAAALLPSTYLTTHSLNLNQFHQWLSSTSLLRTVCPKMVNWSPFYILLNSIWVTAKADTFMGLEWTSKAALSSSPQHTCHPARPPLPTHPLQNTHHGDASPKIELQRPALRPVANIPQRRERVSLGPYFRAATAVMILPWEHNTCQPSRNKLSFHMQNVLLNYLPLNFPRWLQSLQMLTIGPEGFSDIQCIISHLQIFRRTFHFIAWI